MNSHSCPRMVVLGSGSSGNATAVTDGVTTVLIDCGFSAREVARRLVASGIEPSSLAALLVTHEHSDHVRGIDVFCRRHAPRCVVHSTSRTWRACETPSETVAWQEIRRDEVFAVESFRILAFRTSHDAVDPVGYRIETPAGVVGIVTDTGVLTPDAEEALAGCEVLGLESNHDSRMLETGPYPAFLKHRIRSSKGHLSNVDAANALERLAHDGLRHVVGMHRSTTNNTKRLVGDVLETRVRDLSLAAKVSVASQELAWDSHPPQECLFD